MTANHDPDRDALEAALAGRGERDGSWPARSLHQFVAYSAFERRDLLRHSALRVAKLNCRLRERVGTRNGLECGEMSHLHAEG